MRKYTKSLLKSVEETTDKPYIGWVKDELKLNNVRVHKWGKFDWDETYYAYFDSRRVYIPIPECKTSLFIALHEIGHIVKGERLYGYLAEYQAEQWAIQVARDKYNIISKTYENSARKYVYDHILEDVVYRLLPIKRIQKKVMKWIGVTPEKIQKDALKVCTRLSKELQCEIPEEHRSFIQLQKLK